MQTVKHILRLAWENPMMTAIVALALALIASAATYYPIPVALGLIVVALQVRREVVKSKEADKLLDQMWEKIEREGADAAKTYAEQYKPYRDAGEAALMQMKAQQDAMESLRKHHP